MFAAQYIPYKQTNFFSKIILDYLAGSTELKAFYSNPATLQGLESSIRQKQKENIDRASLVDVLRDQYKNVVTTAASEENIEKLLSPKTFSVCTAHQPNLFTGPLYFIYKILHVVRLAETLNTSFSGYHFVPVYYMGSEDADLAELNHFVVDGKKYEWNTDQKGAVGRMLVDKKIISLLDELEKQLSVEPYGNQFIKLLRDAYTIGTSIQEATFRLVNDIFGQFGLVVLIADDARLKKQILNVFEDDLFQQKPSEIVANTCRKLEKHYKIQASPREVNLFYLKDDIRERIIKIKDHYEVNGTSLKFNAQEIRQELNQHPERFSPNVILRGLYQESILPNIAFIGGGGELAYWLQLKDLFLHYDVSFPVLVLRNSILLVEEKWVRHMDKLGISPQGLFETQADLIKKIVAKLSGNQLNLNGKFERAEEFYEQIRVQVQSIDPTLTAHVNAIKANSIKKLQQLEKKMLRAEKRKFSDQQVQVQKLKTSLFPNNGLQERVANIGWFYARRGPSVINDLLHASPALENKFIILTDQIH